MFYENVLKVIGVVLLAAICIGVGLLLSAFCS